MEFIISLLTNFWYLWVLVLLVMLYRAFRPAIKGFFGEKSVAVYLSTLDPGKYRVMNDVLLRRGEGTSQIDHLVISNYGLFVIETKNY